VTSGIGAAIAKVLAQAGCDVAGCGSRPADSEGARAFIESVEAEGRKALYLTADLSNKQAPADFIRDAAEALGGIDLLVSNAGRNIFEGAKDCSEEAWEECMNLDLASHWRLAQTARPHLEKSDPGVILIIGSNHAWGSIPGCFPYNVAKAGLLGLVQSLAIEWGPDIRTVGIAPGFIDTAGNQIWFDSFPDPAAERARTEVMHPVGRIGRVEEIGQLCAYLASPMAGFISGTTLCVDGGRSALMQDG
jgi:NAD(P)-dependent dehydrogenase (short-subunit alcohol dehydrogenase family)